MHPSHSSALSSQLFFSKIAKLCLLERLFYTSTPKVAWTLQCGTSSLRQVTRGRRGVLVIFLWRTASSCELAQRAATRNAVSSATHCGDPWRTSQGRSVLAVTVSSRRTFPRPWELYKHIKSIGALYFFFLFLLEMFMTVWGNSALLGCSMSYFTYQGLRFTSMMYLIEKDESDFTVIILLC